MNLLINGKTIEIKNGANILEAMAHVQSIGEYFAVALNKNFIPKSQYEKTILKDNDELEIVTPHPGG